MKLFTFGDSWTEGVGGNLEEEYTTNISEERTKIRHKYSWPTHLSKLLKCNVENYGVGAFSNNLIFNTVCHKLKNEFITQDDFVIIMWSSSLRDDVPFFPNENNFNIWGNRYKVKEHLIKHIFDGIKGENVKYNRAEKNFRDYYISDLYNETYYNIINQNYIIHLQFLFSQLGIRYLFCDAFDLMIQNTDNPDIDKSSLINPSRYWGFKENTLRDFLDKLKNKNVWEDKILWDERTLGKHPNNEGYQLIAEELYGFILKNDLLKENSTKISNLI